MRTLLYIVILIVAAGCSVSGYHMHKLDEAQRLMHTDPTAAMSALNAIDVSEFQDSATMARWALLYSEAMVVNSLSAPADTIVDIAIAYYGSHNNEEAFHKASRLKAMLSGTGADPLVTALYLQKEKEFLLYKERIKRQRSLYVGILLLLIAVGVILWMRQQMRLKSLLNETLMAEASGLKVQIETDRMDVGRLETKLQDMLHDRFALIDTLCQTYYESQGTKSERKAIVEKVKGEIESMRSDSFPVMEETVNDCRDNMLVRVKESCPDMKVDDYRLLVYIASGLSPRAISLLLGESVEVIYKRKSRLKARMKGTVSTLCPEIMTIF